jgi:RecA/RadA recombinase
MRRDRELFAEGRAALEVLALADAPPESRNGTHANTNRAADATNDDAPVKRLSLVCAADVRMEAVTYLWQERVPRGKLTCIDGRMGVGKTTVLTTITGAVTRGGSLPGQATTLNGAAILISLEDGLADTLVPRLQAAGADLSKCHLFNGYEFGGERSGGVFSLAEDSERLRWAIVENGAVFVAIDPFTATLGGAVNSYKDQDVRRVLAPLAQVAEDTGAAILFTRHFRKGGGVAEDAGGGSVGIGAACRSVLRVDADPENPERFLLSSVKSSVSKKPLTLGYRIEGVTFPGSPPVSTSRIVWDGESSWTAEALAAQAMGTDERPRADEAQDWLRDALGSGSKSAKELFRAADAEGIPRRTLQRAADVLQVAKERKGFGEGSMWSLPASIRAMEPPFVPSISTARMGTNAMNDGSSAVDVAI